VKRFQVFLLLLSAASFPAAAQTPAFPFTYYMHDTTGVNPDAPLPAIYQFGATSVGSSSHVVIKAINTSGVAAFMGEVFVSQTVDSTVLNNNFTVSGLAAAISVPAGGSLLFAVNFSPTSTGPMTAYMQTTYQVQQNGCDFTSTVAADQCPSGLNLSATLTASATEPQLVLSYNSAAGSTLLQPSSSPLNFGNVSTSATSSVTFTLSNQSTVPITTPSITVPAPTIYSSNAYSLDVSQVPGTLAAGVSATFTVTFAPGQIGLVATSLIVGANSYPIQGEGIIVASIDELQIYYVDSTGVRTLPQAATPISFGQQVAGAGTANVLSFSITNPDTSFNSVTVPSLTTSGTGYTMSAVTGASSFPTDLAPGATLNFSITFTGTSSGTYAGALHIGTRSFLLSAVSISSPLPSFSLSVNPSPLSSQQQATVAVQFSAASALDLVGTISMAFAPSVSSVSDDPAVMFMTNSSRQLSLTVASGTQTATFNGQSAFTFQTGTTAGTITFTVTFPNTPAYTQSFTIPPASAQIISATAVRSTPNLVVTVAGYDNTYSAGQLNFTFYDLSGSTISPISVNAASNFESLFFGSTNTTGGAFSLQATFPVTGDVSKVGSVAITISNSVGQANTTATFQ
jgi:hypothetical protein